MNLKTLVNAIIRRLRRRTVASALADLNRTARRLNETAAEANARVEVIYDQMDVLANEARATAIEARHAERVSARIAQLCD
ncbi:MAG: hypothetical protein ACXIUZ_01940 [Lysobacteraceae bacterium]